MNLLKSILRIRLIDADSRPIVSKDNLEDVLYDLKTLIKSKIVKHGPRTYFNSHHALGVITEEYWELIEAVKSNDENRVLEELMDVAVACVWAAASQYQYMETK